MELDSHKSINQALKMISELITLVIQPIREGGNLLAIMIIIVIKCVITQCWLLFDRGRHSRVVCDVTGRPAVAIIPNVKRFSAAKKVTHRGFLWGRKI